MMVLNNIFYYGKNALYKCYNLLFHQSNKPQIAGRTALEEASEYEKKNLSRFLRFDFVKGFFSKLEA